MKFETHKVYLEMQINIYETSKQIYYTEREHGFLVARKWDYKNFDLRK